MRRRNFLKLGLLFGLPSCETIPDDDRKTWPDYAPRPDVTDAGVYWKKKVEVSLKTSGEVSSAQARSISATDIAMKGD